MGTLNRRFGYPDDEEELAAGDQMLEPDTAPDFSYSGFPDVVDVEQAASQPVEPEAMPSPRPVERSTGGEKSTGGAKEESGGWSPNWLAAAAAWTKNPALMEMLRERNARPGREAAAALAKEDRDLRRKQLEQAEMYRVKKDAREDEELGLKKKTADSSMTSRTAYADAARQRTANEQEERDPASESSKRYASAAAQALMARAEIVAKANPQVADTLRAQAQRIGSASAKQAKAALEALGPVGKEALAAADQSHDNWLANRAADRGDRSLDQGDQRIAMDAAEDARKASGEIGISKSSQGKLNADISKLENRVNQLGEIGRLKGNVKTGPIIQAMRDTLKLDSFDETTSEDRAKLRSLSSQVFDQIINDLAGANVPEGEMVRLRRQIPDTKDDDNTFRIKLNTALETANGMLAEKRKEYQHKGNRPTDLSTTASEQMQKLAPTKSSPQTKAPHGQRVKQGGKTFEWNGTKYVEVP
jgi:hypothetical protein